MSDSALFDQAAADLLEAQRRARYADMLDIATALVDVVADGPAATPNAADMVSPSETSAAESTEVASFER